MTENQAFNKGVYAKKEGWPRKAPFNLYKKFPNHLKLLKAWYKGWDSVDIV